MATTQSITSTYAGEDSGKYFSAVLKSADTFEKNIISINPNVKFKSVLHKLETGDGTTDFACDFTAAGSVTLTEKILEPKKLMVNMTLCKENYVETWEAISMGFGADNANLPDTFTDYFIARVLEAQSAKIDSDIWEGETGNTGEFDGFTTLWESDTAVLSATSATTITASNVIAELGRVYDLIPDAIINKPDLIIAVSANVARAYKRALSALGFRLDYTVGDKPLDFEGITIESIGGMEANTIAAFQTSNLWFGTGLMNDFQELSVLDMHDHDLSDNVRFKMVYTAACQYISPEEIVYYKA